jgi:capsular polysaccharide biosynthesis protein
MYLFSPPSLDDLIRLLKAWKFWALGAILGAVIGATVYVVAPPPYRARATVLVDFNLEEAFPQDTDRQYFYYLERETRKLEEIAWSDAVMEELSTEFGISVEELRGGMLELSQPAEGGWHFYANNYNVRQAVQVASTWAQLFTEQVNEKVANSEGLNPFIRVDMAQAENLPSEPSLPLSTYLLIGAIGFLAVSAFVILFFGKPK